MLVNKIVFVYLHKSRDGLYSLIGLVEDLPPRVRCSRGSCVLRGLGQKIGHVLHAPVCPDQLGVEETSAGVVLQEGLFRTRIY